MRPAKPSCPDTPPAPPCRPTPDQRKTLINPCFRERRNEAGLRFAEAGLIPAFDSLRSELLHIKEDDDKGEQGERFDERKAQNQKGKDTRPRSRIARQRLRG